MRQRDIAVYFVIVLVVGMLLGACGAAVPETESVPESLLPGSSRPLGGVFRVDPYWPLDLPGNWLLGNVVGVVVDSADNVWIIHRPNSQRGTEDTPPVIAFGPDGNVVRSWGGQVSGTIGVHKPMASM
jgi:hypothetical protein